MLGLLISSPYINTRQMQVTAAKLNRSIWPSSARGVFDNSVLADVRHILVPFKYLRSVCNRTFQKILIPNRKTIRAQRRKGVAMVAVYQKPNRPRIISTRAPSVRHPQRTSRKQPYPVFFRDASLHFVLPRKSRTYSHLLTSLEKYQKLSPHHRPPPSLPDGTAPSAPFLLIGTGHKAPAYRPGF